jgi:uncharacterized protein YcaQ
MTTRIMKADVRRLLLSAQGFGGVPPPPTRAGVLDTIRGMHALQIDTISVVARSQYLVLWSRIGMYSSALLDELATAGELFEYWSHAACFVPADDYPLYRRLMIEGAGLPWRRRSEAWLREHQGNSSLTGMCVRRSGSFASVGLIKLA